MNQIEIWKPVVSREAEYEVSNLGAVRSLDRVIRKKNGSKATIRAKRLVGWIQANGYQAVRLGRGRHVYVHRLVLGAFLGDPGEGEEACHNNGVRADNRLDNLRWGTRKENAADRIQHGTASLGEDNHQGKLTTAAVLHIRQSDMQGVELAKLYGVSKSTVSMAKNRRTWRHV